MADLTVQRLSQTGLNPSFSAAGASGDTFTNDGNCWLHIKNGGASPVTVTITARTPCNHGTLHNLAITVPAGEERISPRLEQSRFNDSNGKVSISYSATTSVTVGVFGL
jgi:hypothetical protein